MEFKTNQIENLQAPLNKKHVRERQGGGGMTLSYIEGHHAIREANRIFGFGGWDRETISLEKLREPTEVNGKWNIDYMAQVRITVGDSLVREGTGYGNGIGGKFGQAAELAIKEAETDAMKRALMTFGNQFGLALYDKQQEHVIDVEKEEWKSWADKAIAEAGEIRDQIDLDRWFKDFEEDYKRCFATNKAQGQRVNTTIAKMKAQIETANAA